MNTPVFQNPDAVRRRARYSNDFKRKVIAAPKPKKVSTLGVVRTNPAFLPVQFESASITQADIRIELQQGTTTVRIQWPMGASSQCAAWLKEVLQ